MGVEVQRVLDADEAAVFEYGARVGVHNRPRRCIDRTTAHRRPHLIRNFLPATSTKDDRPRAGVHEMRGIASTMSVCRLLPNADRTLTKGPAHLVSWPPVGL